MTDHSKVLSQNQKIRNYKEEKSYTIRKSQDMDFESSHSITFDIYLLSLLETTHFKGEERVSTYSISIWFHITRRLVTPARPQYFTYTCSRVNTNQQT